MWILTLLSLLVGMVLGQRFKVLILLPLSAIALLLTIALQALVGDGLWPALLAAAAVMACLQVGYIDHFAFSQANEPLAPATDAWLALCRRGYGLWMQSKKQAAA